MRDPRLLVFHAITILGIIIGSHGSPLLWEGRESYFQASEAHLAYSGQRVDFANDTSRRIPLSSSTETKGEDPHPHESVIYLPIDAKHMVALSFQATPESQQSTSYRLSLAQTIWSHSKNATDKEATKEQHASRFGYSEYHTDPTVASKHVMGGDSQNLWFCDSVEIEMPAVSPAAVPTTLHAQHVLLGAFLPKQYNVCDMDINYACGGAWDRCEWRQGQVHCIPTNMLRFDAETLKVGCDQSLPQVPVPLGPKAVRWRGRYGYLQALESRLLLPNGHEFNTTTEEPAKIYTGVEGEVLDVAWRNERGSYSRQLHLSAVFPNRRQATTMSLTGRPIEGWKVHNAFLYNPHFRQLSMRGNRDDVDPQNDPEIPNPFQVKVPTGYDALHCENVKINFPTDSEEEQTMAQWVMKDFIYGAYLPQHYDICNLRIFNPCEAVGTCVMIDGDYKCERETKRTQAPNSKIHCTHMGPGNRSDATTKPFYLSNFVGKSAVQTKETYSYMEASSLTIQQEKNNFYEDVAVSKQVRLSSPKGSEIRVLLSNDYQPPRVLQFLFAQAENASSTRYLKKASLKDLSLSNTNESLHSVQFDKVSSAVKIPPGYDAFYCDKVHFSLQNSNVSSNPRQRMEIDNLLLAAYMPLEYDLCSLRIYSPCPKSQCLITDHETKCQGEKAGAFLPSKCQTDHPKALLSSNSNASLPKVHHPLLTLVLLVTAATVVAASSLLLVRYFFRRQRTRSRFFRREGDGVFR